MALRETLEKTGNWLFRWRSYMPLVLLVPLLVDMTQGAGRPPDAWMEALRDAVGFAISLTGFAVRVLTIGHVPEGTSGRNTKRQIARLLNTTGTYSLLRHPLYFGNFLMWLGVVLSCCTWPLVVVFLLAFAMYYERIMFAEEEFLRRKFGQTFLEWAAATPAFLPRFSNWTPPSLPFSLRKALRHEYSGWFAMVAAFCAVKVLEHAVVESRLTLEPVWGVLFLVGLTIYLVLRTLKKHTRLLTTDGC